PPTVFSAARLLIGRGGSAPYSSPRFGEQLNGVHHAPEGAAPLLRLLQIDESGELRLVQGLLVRLGHEALETTLRVTERLGVVRCDRVVLDRTVCPERFQCREEPRLVFTTG